MTEKGEPTHTIGLHVWVSTPEQWDHVHKTFSDLMKEWTDDYHSVHLSSWLMDEEPGVEEDGEYYDEFTKLRVINTIKEALDANHGVFVTGSSAVVLNELAGDIAEFLEEAGILFRERRRPVEEA